MVSDRNDPDVRFLTHFLVSTFVCKANRSHSVRSRCQGKTAVLIAPITRSSPSGGGRSRKNAALMQEHQRIRGQGTLWEGSVSDCAHRAFRRGESDVFPSDLGTSRCVSGRHQAWQELSSSGQQVVRAICSRPAISESTCRVKRSLGQCVTGRRWPGRAARISPAAVLL